MVSISPIVLCMCEDVADIDDLTSILNHRDEPALISADVENRENIHHVGVRKIRADVGDVSPCSALGYAEPQQERFHGILMRAAEFGDRRLADDPDVLKLPKR
jgi:hypothetical protein